MQLIACKLGPPQDESNLRTVSVRDRNFPALLDETCNMVACLCGSGVLILNALVVSVRNQ